MELELERRKWFIYGGRSTFLNELQLRRHVRSRNWAELTSSSIVTEMKATMMKHSTIFQTWSLLIICLGYTTLNRPGKIWGAMFQP